MSHVSSSPNTPSGSMATKPFMIGDDQKHGQYTIYILTYTCIHVHVHVLYFHSKIAKL